MSEAFKKAVVEAALNDCGWAILQEEGGFTIYQTHFSPGDDLVLDWSRGEYRWEDILPQLESQDIDYQCIQQRLTDK